ncbi:hypothetical protein TVAG_453720 [Trichomonas vaginalis G3]|uniref:Uncharacterized protein n=1 Tax=Trichomonas vaginalis (strain ATCC PRA-98 / G3) TaxID=412133 RepID=A2DPU8_TRIV3|nr:GAF domain-like family [Trichomonas vaginalis G3]EAY17544.1 hypothetical protein TVAG_453720 [Trichomonas vaginalis G3]KAI5520588.1 GAF domain-like family [Trichomonas vaginalis G3]|eukprot:XP_001329679.1 hypothetical protein [Trichomonas vaginalis G3]
METTKMKYIDSYNMERVEYIKGETKQKLRMMSKFQDEIKNLKDLIEQEKQAIEKFQDYTERISSSSKDSQTNEKVAPESSNTKSIIKECDIALSQKVPPIYESPTTEKILNALQPSMDFELFFRDYPIVYASLFDDNIEQINYRSIFEYIEKWEINSRTSFINAFFKNLNSAASLVSLLSSIVEHNTISELSEYIETKLPSLINVNRAVFMQVEDGKLVLEKQRLKFSQKMAGGKITRAVNINSALIATKSSLEIDTEDSELMKLNQTMLIQPIDTHKQQDNDPVIKSRMKQSQRMSSISDKKALARVLQSSKNVSKPFRFEEPSQMEEVELTGMKDSASAVLLLFDCFGGFHNQDLITAYVISKFIGETIPLINLRAKYHYSKTALQRALDVLIKLAAVSDLKELKQTLCEGIMQQFKCEAVTCFKVMSSGKFFSIGNDSETFPAKSGLVGEAIATKRSMAISNPELSVLFNSATDRCRLSTPTRSILISQIFNSTGNVAYSIALYNKINVDEFSNDDLVTLELLCFNVNSIFDSVGITHELTKSAAGSKNVFSVYSKIFDTLSSTPDVGDVVELSKFLTHQITDSIHKNITFFIYDEKLKTLKCTDSISGFEVSIDESYSLVEAFKQQEPMEEISNEENVMSQIFPLEMGLIKVKADSPISIIQSKMSMIGWKPLPQMTTKSMLEIKIEKLTNVQPMKVRPIRKNSSIMNTLGPWAKVCSPLISLSILSSTNIQKLIVLANFARDMPNDDLTVEKIFLDFVKDMDFGCFSAFASKYCGKLIREFISPIESSYVSPSRPTLFCRDNKLDYGFNVFTTKLEDLVSETQSIFQALGLTAFFNDTVISQYFEVIRSKHNNNLFRNYRLCLDHCQFAAAIMKTMDIEKPDMLCILLYLLSLYCDISPSTVVFCAESLCSEPPFNIDKDIIYKAFVRFDKCETFDVLFDSDISSLVCAISRYSYLARSLDTMKKFVDQRFSEDNESDQEVQKFIIEYEMRSFIIPCCGEFAKRNIRTDAFRKLFTSNASAITHSVF